MPYLLVGLSLFVFIYYLWMVTIPLRSKGSACFSIALLMMVARRITAILPDVTILDNLYLPLVISVLLMVGTILIRREIVSEFRRIARIVSSDEYKQFLEVVNSDDYNLFIKVADSEQFRMMADYHRDQNGGND